MARLELDGFDGLNDALRRISEIPWETTAEALSRMAAVAEEKIRRSGSAMNVRDPDSAVHILDKVKAKKPRKTDGGGYADITFDGSRQRGKTRTRNAEIAFINEYGKRGQPARPFIAAAMTQGEDAIAAPGEKILGDWIEKEFSRD